MQRKAPQLCVFGDVRGRGGKGRYIYSRNTILFELGLWPSRRKIARGYG